MATRIVYCDETGDDGLNTKSSDSFILTSIYMPAESWQSNYDKIKSFRKNLKSKYGFHVLQNALTYNIQRIDNDSRGDWNYLFITDKGRIAPMRKTARAIRAYNPIHSNFGGYINRPVKSLIEDILEKDSKESYFIQICDFVSFFVHLYYKTNRQKKKLPNRVGRLIHQEFIGRVMATFKSGNILNLNASSDPYGLVIYPK